MCGGAQILDYVSVEDADIDVVDSEHLWISKQYWLEALWELRLRIGWLRQRVDVMDFTS